MGSTKRRFTIKSWQSTLVDGPTDHFPCHPESYWATGRDYSRAEFKRKRIRPFAERLSRDPLRAGNEVFFLRRRIDPFDADKLLDTAINHANAAARWLMLHHLERYRMLEACHEPALFKLLEDANAAIRSYALGVITKVRAQAAARRHQDFVLRCFNRERSHERFTALHQMLECGGPLAVCEVSEWVSQVVKRSRRVAGWTTDLQLGCEYLLLNIDRSELVEPAFANVVRYWPNLADEEARHIESSVRWIGMRVIEIERGSSDTSKRVAVQSSMGIRNVYRST